VLGLWLGTTPGHRRSARVAGGLLVYVATLALLLTLSRAGVVVAVVVLVLWLVLSRERVESGLLLVASAVPALLVGAWAFTRPALTEDIATREDRVADGTVFRNPRLVGAALVALVVALGSGRSLAGEARSRVRRRLAVVASLCAIGALAGLAVATSGAVSKGRDCAEVGNDPGRFGTFESARLCWWEEAWDVFVGHSPHGAGAGTFEIARKRYRPDARNVVEPHSVPLQHLSDGVSSGSRSSSHSSEPPSRASAPFVDSTAPSVRPPSRSWPCRSHTSACARRLQLELPRGHGADDGGARCPRETGQRWFDAPPPFAPVVAVFAAVVVVASFSFRALPNRWSAAPRVLSSRTTSSLRAIAVIASSARSRWAIFAGAVDRREAGRIATATPSEAVELS
jgi:hypothetical protein